MVERAPSPSFALQFLSANISYDILRSSNAHPLHGMEPGTLDGIEDLDCHLTHIYKVHYIL
jgi:hypothetical protein